jgi:hypothetical protein
LQCVTRSSAGKDERSLSVQCVAMVPLGRMNTPSMCSVLLWGLLGRMRGSLRVQGVARVSAGKDERSLGVQLLGVHWER